MVPEIDFTVIDNLASVAAVAVIDRRIARKSGVMLNILTEMNHREEQTSR